MWKQERKEGKEERKEERKGERGRGRDKGKKKEKLDSQERGVFNSWGMHTLNSEICRIE